MTKPTTEELDRAQFGRVLHERPSPDPTPAEIELMIEDVENHGAGTVQRTSDGALRTYYAGFNLTALAEHIARELANRT